jgi:addiction module HigA family antidote
MNNAQMANTYVPDYLVTPGEVLEDYLGYTGITQTSLADRTGLSKKTINEIVKAKSAITAETALKFERTLGRPAHFWSNLERQYQEDKVRLADKIQLGNDLQWLNKFPVSAMAKHGWIEKHRDKILQLDALLRFFAVAATKQWEIIWAHDLEAVFRKTEKSEKDAAILSAWLRKGEIEAQQQRCGNFDKQKFHSSLDEIRALTTIRESKTFVPKLESICAAAGIAVVFVPALPKLGIYGATRRVNDKYIIQLSLYGKSNDQLWFTFFHEACHILKHSREELYVEGNGLENEKEKEADAFAQNILIPPEKLSDFLAFVSTPSTSQISRFAARIGIAPGIVVGRLQHDGKISRSWGNDLKIRYKWAERKDE